MEEPAAVILAGDILRWLIPKVGKFPKNVRFGLGARIESAHFDVLDELIRAQYARGWLHGAGMVWGPGSRPGFGLAWRTPTPEDTRVTARRKPSRRWRGCRLPFALPSTLHLRLHRLAAAPDHSGPLLSLSRRLADLAASLSTAA